MNLLLFCKATLIGFCIAAPVGPCGLLCISRSLRGGFRAGVATGLGVTLADSVYATIGVFGVSAMIATLEQWSLPLRIGGALFLILIGTRIALRRQKAEAAELKTASHSDFVSAFLVTLANPLTIFSFIAIFAGMGVSSERGVVVLGVGVGSLTWWLLLSWLSSFFGKRLRPDWLGNLTRFAGWAIAALGVVALLSVGWKF